MPWFSTSRPTELIRPAVRCPTQRYNMKLRAGRGFTLDELKAAGIRRKEALSIGVPVDHRRRNKSEESLKLNKDRLEAYKARLIVFPKKAGKPKKGDTADADKSVEGLKKLSSAFPIPAGMSAEEPRAITAEEKEFNAYTTLRKARSDARYAGIRAERQRKKEEEEAAKKKVCCSDNASFWRYVLTCLTSSVIGEILRRFNCGLSFCSPSLRSLARRLRGGGVSRGVSEAKGGSRNTRRLCIDRRRL